MFTHKSIIILFLGTISISWYPPGMADDAGYSWDDLIPRILDGAEKYKLKVNDLQQKDISYTCKHTFD